MESDAPDALPKSHLGSHFWVENDSSASKVHQTEDVNLGSSGNISDDPAARNRSVLPQETLNHPANIHSVCLCFSLFFFDFSFSILLCFITCYEIIYPTKFSEVRDISSFAYKMLIKFVAFNVDYIFNKLR